MTCKGTAGKSRRSDFKVSRLLLDRQSAVSSRDFAASVHLTYKVAIFLRIFFGSLDYGLGSFDGGSPNSEVAGDLVAGVPLTFRHCGGMTEVRPRALPVPGSPALDRAYGALDGYDFAWQQIFANEILMRFPPGGLTEIDDTHGNFGPSKQTAGCEPPLSGNQPAFRSDHDGVEEAHFLDAARQRA